MRWFSLLFVLTLTLLACHSQSEQLGSRSNPIKLYFTPSVDSDTITTNSQAFLKFLEQETGYYFKSGIPTSYIAVVEAFGSERADVAVMNSFGYIMAHEKYGAQAKLTVIRHGSKSYKGEIITHVDNKIDSIEDLKGKKFAFTDPSSTSGYLFPLKVLKENGVEIAPSDRVFGQKHDNVVTMVYQKQVDAGAAFYSPPAPDGEIRDARARVLTQFPDVVDKVKVIALTDDILNDPFVFRKGLPSEMSEQIVAAIQKFLATDMGKQIFRSIYSVDGLVPATDADYDGLREMLRVLNIDATSFLTQQ